MPIVWADRLPPPHPLRRVLGVDGESEEPEHQLLQPASPVSLQQPSHGGRTPRPLTSDPCVSLPFIVHRTKFHALQKKTFLVISSSRCGENEGHAVDIETATRL